MAEGGAGRIGQSVRRAHETFARLGLSCISTVTAHAFIDCLTTHDLGHSALGHTSVTGGQDVATRPPAPVGAVNVAGRRFLGGAALYGYPTPCPAGIPCRPPVMAGLASAMTGHSRVWPSVAGWPGPMTGRAQRPLAIAVSGRPTDRDACICPGRDASSRTRRCLGGNQQCHLL